MINKSLLDLAEASLKRAEAALQEAAGSQGVRHLRLAGVELLRAVRCGVDLAIDVLEPKRHPKEPLREEKK